MATSESKLTLQFLGAAETVTGSKYLLRVQNKHVLIDCGLFQGLKKLRLLNRQPLPVNAQEIDAVVLTHAHLDHVGFLPLLVKQGFSGPVYCTFPTADLAEIILRDSAKLQEEEARLANEEGFSSHKPAEPLYMVHDVENTIPLFKPVKEGTWFDVCEGVSGRLKLNGHVLGAAFLELEAGGKKLVFSGDIGRRNDLLLYEPERPVHADVLVMESTYGDRLHKNNDVYEHFARIINQTVSRGGSVIVPSFALQRAQMLMFLLWDMRLQKAIPPVQLYMDSPMGAAVMRIFETYATWLKLTERDLRQIMRNVTMIENYKASLFVVNDPRPKVVIASSGMVTGGRVLSYLEEYLEHENCCVVLTGFQAEGTRGRQLQDGATELKIRGNYYKVRAKVEHLTSLSSHADQEELLVWTGLINRPPAHVFLTHGEPQASDALRVKLKHTRGWNATIPTLLEEFDLLG